MQMPFYTRVEEIESSIFNFTIPFIGEQKVMIMKYTIKEF